MERTEAERLVYFRSDETGWGVRIYLYDRCELIHTIKPDSLDFDGLDKATDDAFSWVDDNGYEYYDNY